MFLVLLGWELGPDRNSGPVRYRFQWVLGWYRFRSGTRRFGRYQTGTAFFSMMDYRFSIFCTNELPASRAPPVPWLDHVYSSSSLAGSRAPLLFPWLYHVLPYSPQNLSRAPISPLATLGVVNYLYFHRLLYFY